MLKIYYGQNKLSLTYASHIDNLPSYNCTDRDNEILKQFVNYPPDLGNIIQEYDVCYLKKTKTKFNTVLLKEQNKAQWTLDPYKESINCVIKLNNGLIATASFSGIINIWDPVYGKSIKEIRSFEKTLIENKFIFTKYRKMEMHQLSDDIIIIKEKSKSFFLGKVYIVLINLDITCVIFDIWYGNIYFNQIVPISSNQFITTTSHKTGTVLNNRKKSRVCTWKIEIEKNDTYINIPKTRLHKMTFKRNVKFVQISSDKNKIIIFENFSKKNIDYIVLTVLNLQTYEKLNTIQLQGSIFEIPCTIGNYLLVSLNNYIKLSHKLINFDTLKVTQTLFQIHDDIYKVFYLKKDIYMIFTIQKYDPSYKLQGIGIQIYIIHLPSQTIIQTINTDHPEDIRDICQYRNGFVSLSSRFEINTHDCA